VAENSESFRAAIAFTLADKIEGGYSNDPDDPGGETNCGIAKRFHPKEDIPNMTRERAIVIYHRDYWLANRCDKLPHCVAIALFDFAMNAPAHEARKALQRVVAAKPDGVLGPKSLAKIRKNVRIRGDRVVAIDLVDHRLQRYVRRIRSGKSSKKYLLGWMRRLHHLIVYLYDEGE
jgi:lysozyme family protein